MVIAKIKELGSTEKAIQIRTYARGGWVVDTWIPRSLVFQLPQANLVRIPEWFGKKYRLMDLDAV